MDASEHPLRLRFDLSRDRVAEHRRLDMTDLGAVADLRPPSCFEAVVGIGVQRIVVADAERPVPECVFGGDGIEFSLLGRHVDAEQQLGLDDVLIGQSVLQRLLELLLEFRVHLQRVVGRAGIAAHEVVSMAATYSSRILRLYNLPASVRGRSARNSQRLGTL